jgi:hypothetical protein
VIGRGNEQRLYACDPERVPCPDGMRFMRGVLIGAPISGLLWWGIIAFAKAVM